MTRPYFGEEKDPLAPTEEPRRCSCGGTLVSTYIGNRPALQCRKCCTHYYMDVKCGKRVGVSDKCVLSPGHSGECWSLDQILRREG